MNVQQRCWGRSPPRRAVSSRQLLQGASGPHRTDRPPRHLLRRLSPGPATVLGVAPVMRSFSLLVCGPARNIRACGPFPSRTHAPHAPYRAGPQPSRQLDGRLCMVAPGGVARSKNSAGLAAGAEPTFFYGVSQLVHTSAKWSLKYIMFIIVYGLAMVYLLPSSVVHTV